MRGEAAATLSAGLAGKGTSSGACPSAAPRFADQTPTEVYATLLDEGVYLCSIRTMYRILAGQGEVVERRRLRRHPVYQKPELLAEGPNEVWSWE